MSRLREITARFALPAFAGITPYDAGRFRVVIAKVVYNTHKMEFDEVKHG